MEGCYDIIFLAEFQLKLCCAKLRKNQTTARQKALLRKPIFMAGKLASFESIELYYSLGASLDSYSVNVLTMGSRFESHYGRLVKCVTFFFYNIGLWDTSGRHYWKVLEKPYHESTQTLIIEIG